MKMMIGIISVSGFVGKLTSGMWLINVLAVLLIACVAYGLPRIRKLRSLAVSLKDELDNEQVCLQQLAGEKEWLMREIHHRVKNNLQIMMSLLNMQSSYLEGDEAKLAIRNNSHRLFAISLVHQKLYQTESLSSIDVPLYLNELAQYLQYEFEGTERIALQIHADPLCLDAQAAIPLGLIVNEALSNSFRHGFPDGAKGTVSINLRSEDEFQYLLQIADDGAGFPKGYDSGQQTSLGRSLMVGLSGQLRGKLAIQNDHGVSVTFVFPKESDVAGSKENIAKAS